MSDVLVRVSGAGDEYPQSMHEALKADKVEIQQRFADMFRLYEVEIDEAGPYIDDSARFQAGTYAVAIAFAHVDELRSSNG